MKTRSTGSNQTFFLKFLLKTEIENSILFSENIFLENENSFSQPNAPLVSQISNLVFCFDVIVVGIMCVMSVNAHVKMFGCVFGVIE